MAADARLLSLGLSTALGEGRACACAMAAGLSAFHEVPLSTGEVARAARLASLPASAPRTDRVTALARMAFADLLGQAAFIRSLDVPCLIGIGNDHPGAPIDLPHVNRALTQLLAEHAPNTTLLTPIRAGRAAFFHVLLQAQQLLTNQQHDAVIVGAVDSLCDDDSLARLQAQGRLLNDEQLDGLIPGEGAGFALLASARHARQWGKPWASLITCATAQDPEPHHARQPEAAQALTQLFAQLRLALPERVRPDHVFSSHNGEAFWARELTSAYLRNVALMPEPFRHTPVAQHVGDCGAAGGVVQLLATQNLFNTSWRRGRHTQHALLFGAADSGAAAGCVLSRT